MPPADGLSMPGRVASNVISDSLCPKAKNPLLVEFFVAVAEGLAKPAKHLARTLNWFAV
jgi:hypothetical protein